MTFIERKLGMEEERHTFPRRAGPGYRCWQHFGVFMFVNGREGKTGGYDGESEKIEAALGLRKKCVSDFRLIADFHCE